MQEKLTFVYNQSMPKMKIYPTLQQIDLVMEETGNWDLSKQKGVY